MKYLDWALHRPWVIIAALIGLIAALATCHEQAVSDYEQRCQAVGGTVVLQSKERRICIQAQELQP